MKYLAIALLLISTNTFAYSIGGAYATLISCTYGQWGHQYGNIGTYNVNGQVYTVFFGSNFCQY
jgi:hypothetical protein